LTLTDGTDRLVLNEQPKSPCLFGSVLANENACVFGRRDWRCQPFRRSADFGLRRRRRHRSAESCMAADAWATALLVRGLDEGVVRRWRGAGHIDLCL